ncbi:MAG: hypothetical protein FWC46_01820 [Actinomycetia bacterium]|nr:hypothetical protein [Actinomycetes bacterium]
MRSGVKRGLVVAGIVVAAVVVAFVALMAPVGGRSESYGTNVAYRDAGRTQAVSVTVTYSLTSSRSESYPVRPLAASLPVSWTAPDTSAAGTVSLRRDGKELQRQPVSGSGCTHWPVDGGAAYQIVIAVGPGDGTVSIAWDEAADCG